MKSSLLDDCVLQKLLSTILHISEYCPEDEKDLLTCLLKIAALPTCHCCFHLKRALLDVLINSAHSDDVVDASKEFYLKSVILRCTNGPVHNHDHDDNQLRDIFISMETILNAIGALNPSEDERYDENGEF